MSSTTTTETAVPPVILTELIDAIVEQQVKVQELEVQIDLVKQKHWSLSDDLSRATETLWERRMAFDKYLTDKATRRRHTT